jgi:ankyrin repeat protein
MAALDNRIDVMDLLVEEHGVDVNTPNVYRDDWSQSILAEVAESGIITAVTWLVEHGADLEATNSLNHYTPLWAACSGYLRVVRILLEAGANPNCVKASSGNSALYMCAQHDRVAFAAELLHFGADPNLTHQPVQSGGVKMTPVMVALCNGHCEMLAMLMNAGA